ncbi:hypothetical protein CDAR_367761 [Caerostris darwini]|uniref:Uncharacterized protein n=1 Tax=Caerostris darwini TaxID=1538125 RepID=A0AAV4T3Z4_9ARAC|nr:hypothetical protein CDAR_367761 [Caerostris darwini]
MKKIGKLIGANQQLCHAHGIQLGVIDVLYQKNKEQKIPNTVDTETSDSNFEERKSNCDNEEILTHKELLNVIVEEDIYTNENEILTHKELSNPKTMIVLIYKLGRTFENYY